MQLNRDSNSTSGIVEKPVRPLGRAKLLVMAELRAALNSIEPAEKSVIITTHRGLAEIKNLAPENQTPSANPQPAGMPITVPFDGVPVKVFADVNVASASAVLAWAEGYTVVLFLPERNMLKVYE